MPPPAAVPTHPPPARPSTMRTVEKRKARDLMARTQVRRTFPPEGELGALARSVQRRQIHPLIVLAPAPNVILDGECRWRGMMTLDPEFEFDVIVVDREMTPAEITEMQLVSALHSTSLGAYDQAVACREWLEQSGATATELAEKIDRDPSTITRLNSLWKTVPAVVEAAAAGRIGPKAWYQLSLLPDADQEKLLSMYLSGMPAAHIESIGKQKRRATAAKPSARLSRVRVQLPGKVSVVLSGADLSLDDVAEALSEAQREVRKARDQGIDVKAFNAVQTSKAKAV
jgi:hypothetical protein